MKVHVICHGLFGIVVPRDRSFVDAVFLDAAGWNDTRYAIPRHELFVRYTSGRGRAELERVSRPEQVEIAGMPETACEILSRPISMPRILGGGLGRLRPACEGLDSSACQLNAAPLVRARVRLRGGVLRNCEYHLVNGVDLDPRRGSWGSQHLEYTWEGRSGAKPVLSNTFNGVVFTFEASAGAALKLGGKTLELGRASDQVARRFRQLEGDSAVITFNNTVPKSAMDGHFHVDPNRDTHSLLLYEMVEFPDGMAAHRPIPRLTTGATAGLEAPPLNRCIPYSYDI